MTGFGHAGERSRLFVVAAAVVAGILIACVAYQGWRALAPLGTDRDSLLRLSKAGAVVHTGRPDAQQHAARGSQRVAVNFFGLTRSLSYTIESIQRNLLGPITHAGYQVRKAPSIRVRHALRPCSMQC